MDSEEIRVLETLDCHGKTGMDIVRAARHYLGIPYHHAGRSETGIDCGGLFIQSMKNCGISTDWDRLDYSAILDCEWIKQSFERFCSSIPLGEKQPGDVGIFTIARQPQHIAIFTDIGIIHTFTSVQRVVETPLSKGWEKHLVTVYRLRGLSTGEVF